jgi:hypothetical protein
MNAFMLDIWTDLREKRLWPVAVVLLLALIAVPVVLSKPSEEAPPIPAPSVSSEQTEEAEKGLAALTVAEVQPGDGEGSTLDVFDPSDPFKPPADVIANSEDDTGGDPALGGEAAPAGTGEAAPATGGAPDSGTTTSPDSGGTTPDTGGGGGTTTVEYRYVIDVTFTANGRTRKIKGMERLDILPREDNPLLIFLGASSNGGNAVFLVDSTLTAAGEGKCKPSDDDCAFLHLGAGSRHQFTNDEGDSYTLRVDQIRRVKVKTSGTTGGGSGDDSGEAGGESASVSMRSETAARRFVPPLITDLVAVSGADDLSDGDPSGR